jgi:hypothetical protein
MAIAVRDKTSFAVEIEDTEGQYKAPTSGESYVQVLKDGAEMTRSQELLERNIFTGSIGKAQSRLGTRSVSGSMGVEMRAGEVEGESPEADKLYTSALGSKKTRVSVTTGEGNTASVLSIPDEDISEFSVNDIVLVKEAGNFQLSWVASVDEGSGEGDASITLGLVLEDAPADNVEIAAVTQYSASDTGHPSLSISKYIEDKVLEQAVGCKVTSMSVENFTTGQIPSVSFGFEGLSFDSSLTPSPFSPDYDDSLPPIALRACILQNGNKIQVNDFTLSVENTLGFVTSTCSENGRISSRVTERSITGTINPYKDDESLTQFNKFKCNTPYTLFVYAFNPQLDGECEFDGEFDGAVAFLLPNCITTELGESDQDGLLIDDVTFEANRGVAGTVEELKVAFI